jgi:predicted nuclease of restriction endonuclease-like (RecB) superfamily
LKTKPPDAVFRDPYFLDFLELADTYSEKDLEAAILREMERFILELGTGFAFVARQKRIVVDGHDFYIDLLPSCLTNLRRYLARLLRR